MASIRAHRRSSGYTSPSTSGGDYPEFPLVRTSPNSPGRALCPRESSHAPTVAHVIRSQRPSPAPRRAARPAVQRSRSRHRSSRPLPPVAARSPRQSRRARPRPAPPSPLPPSVPPRVGLPRVLARAVQASRAPGVRPAEPKQATTPRKQDLAAGAARPPGRAVARPVAGAGAADERQRAARKHRAARLHCGSALA